MKTHILIQYKDGLISILKKPAAWVFILLMIVSIQVGKNTAPTWRAETISLDVKTNLSGDLYYVFKKKEIPITKLKEKSESILTNTYLDSINNAKKSPEIMQEFIYEVVSDGATLQRKFYLVKASKHYKFWSLLPAITAIILCWVTREPLTALFAGILSGSFLLGNFDIIELTFLPRLMTKGAVGITILYLWLLGGLMGIWAKTGAAQAFAEYMTKNFVKGPKTAKLVAWMLGIIFFQGGTVSTVLVGTTVRPLADKENISHEELSYIVDSTASPIATIIPFNAWPGYVQAFIFVSGVPFLATETDRLIFFFKSIPLSFYSIFAIIGTFLLSIDKAPFLGKQLKEAINRSRSTGALDAPGAEPLAKVSIEDNPVAKDYNPHIIDFFVPLGVLIGTAIGTYIAYGSPQVRWAFGLSLATAILLGLIRGLKIKELLNGLEGGFKSVIMGTLILLFAVTIGGLSKEAGGGQYLVELLGNTPYWILPVILQVLTMLIAFSTGTSWGTYAVTFPLAMPLAWAISQSAALGNPYFFMLICFAAVLNGSVYGDQCSPISDTTVLSSICTGCDLMDHVKTQIIPATTAAFLAGLGWTLCAIFFT